MATDLVHVGFGNFLAMDRVIAIVSPSSAPVKRLVMEAKSKGQVVDLTSGRRTKATLLMDTGQIVLAGISAETIAGRVTARAALEMKDGKGREDLFE